MKTPDGIILSCSSLELSLQERSFFVKTNPLGFVLFKRNYSDKDQLRNLISDLKEITLNKNLLIFVDQEGGKVQRFDGEGFTKFPAQSFFGDIYKNDKKKSLELAYKSSFLMGTELKNIGVDVTFSPVCDLFFPDSDDVIGSRSFSENPKAVLDLSKAFCKGFNDSDIYPVLKHFPGHGRSKFDTHFKKSIIENSLEEITKSDLVPFKLLKNEKMVMLAHIIYKNIDNKVATFSKVINNELLRNLLSFKGLILSDDLSMKALSGDIISKVKKTYDAGCDVILYCQGILDEMQMMYPFSRKIDVNNFKYFISKKPQKYLNNDILSIRKELIKNRVITQ
jgi:beta-N-acetylhexosaminidase